MVELADKATRREAPTADDRFAGLRGVAERSVLRADLPLVCLHFKCIRATEHSLVCVFRGMVSIGDPILTFFVLCGSRCCASRCIAMATFAAFVLGVAQRQRCHHGVRVSVLSSGGRLRR